MFPGQEIQLTDFGLARIETRGQDVSASGTLGYMAPEQAMGHPTYRSDVFSLGLVIYRMLAGELPMYPFQGPLPGFNRLRRGLSKDLVALIRLHYPNHNERNNVLGFPDVYNSGQATGAWRWQGNCCRKPTWRFGPKLPIRRIA